jgi:hypothetical protein
MNPVAIIKGALEAIAHEDEQHQQIMLNAVRAELDAMQGGCPCEQLARTHMNTRINTMVWHGLKDDLCQIERITDAETIAGSGKTVAEATRDLHD